MIHISNSKASPSLTSTMCSRRHRGMLQTSIILVLICCIGYGFYLYNLLQSKIKYLDSKALHHQSKHQSLSSQLQVVYEDRARLEKAVQNSKSELQKTKEEFDKHRKSKEEIIQQMLIEHQDREEALKGENADMKVIHDFDQEVIGKHDREMAELQNKQIMTAGEHTKLVQKHKELIDMHAESAKELRETQDKYRRENQELQRNQQALQLEMQQAKEGETQYQNLKYILKALPAGVVNLQHPAVANLGPNGKQILLDHLAPDAAMQQLPAQERDSHNQQGILQDDQSKQDYKHVQKLLETDDQRVPAGGRGYIDAGQQGYQLGVQGQYQRIDTGLENAQQPELPQSQMREIDICSLPPDVGPCGESHARFYHNNDLRECRTFTFGGCGGNENNFQTWEDCSRICSDPERRFIQKAVSEEEQVKAMYEQNENRDMDYHPTSRDDHQPDYNGQANMDAHDIQRVHADEQDNEDDGENVGGGDEDDQQKISEDEMRARQQEELARKEMEAQHGDNGEPIGRDDDPLAKLQKISEEQMKVAKDQEDSMRKLIEQQQNGDGAFNPTDNNQIEARISDQDDNDDPNNGKDREEEYTDEQEEDEDEEDNGQEDDAKRKEEDDVQVAVPPAAQVAGQDPEAVMNRPPPVGQAGDEVDNHDPYDGKSSLNHGHAVEQNNDPQYERDRPRDPGDEYIDENQPEEDDDMGEEEDFNQDGDRDRYHQDGGRGDFDQGLHRANFVEDEKDETENNREEEDGYEDDEDDQEEEDRLKRDSDRIQNDKHFAAMQQMEDVIPQQGVHFERENREM